MEAIRKGCNIMAKKKTLLDKWRAKAYDETADKGNLQKLWIEYFQKEKEIYQQLLDPRSVLE